MKRTVSFILMIALLLSLPACAPKPEDVFKKEADGWFATYTETQTGAKGAAEYAYNEKGSVAAYAPKLSEVNAGTEINEYYSRLRDEFALRAETAADKLFISYQAYRPADGVLGVVVGCSQTLGGENTVVQEYFSYVDGEKFTPDPLFCKMLRIVFRDEFAALEPGDEFYGELTPEMVKGREDFDVFFMNDYAIVGFEYEGRYRSFAVDYGDIHQVLPDALKEKFPDSGKYPVDIGKKLVAFTFDDGPHKQNSEKILNTVEKYGAPVTFFDVGTNIGYYPEIIKRGDALGCEMGTHSWDHANLQTSSEEKIKSQLEKANAAYKEVLGRDCKLMRPPYGAVGDAVKRVCEQYMIGWSVDTLDWKYRDKSSVISYVKRERTLEGDVILMHSLYDSTAAAFAELVPWAQENGYELVTVSDLMKYYYEADFEQGKYYSADFFNGKVK